MGVPMPPIDPPKAQMSIMAIATFDTDYVLVREDQLASAIAALEMAGHKVLP